MGVHREFNFEDDIELLNLKYQMNGLNISEYFTKEVGVGEPIIQIEPQNEQKMKNQL